MSTSTTLKTARPRQVIGQGEQRILLRGIDWQLFDALAQAIGEQPIRLTYDRGNLELMSPSPLHDRYKKLFGRLVEDLLVELRIPFEAAGESLWRQEAEERGLEADECYFVDPTKIELVRGRAVNRPGDPFPDLAIEVEVTSGLLDKLAVYANLRVPEVWHFDGEQVRILGIRPDGGYDERAESAVLPVQSEEILEWIHRASSSDMLAWSLELREWARTDLAARLRAANG